MTRRFPAAGASALLLVFVAASCGAQPLARSAFAWHAPLELPAGTSVARVNLPPEALLRLQSRDARDLRVFNSAGEAVPYAFMPVPPAPTTSTRSYAALQLQSGAASRGRPQGSVQVRIEEGGSRRAVWVDLASSGGSGGATAQSALFATRDEQQTLKALKVQGSLPSNTPVQVLLSTSTDLAQWSSVPVRGRLYRFDGEGAPANDTLEFETPLRIEGRYLRLDWDAPGVAVQAVSAIAAPSVPTPASVRAQLPPAKAVDKGALEIETGFLTPMAAITLGTATPNTLLPVRILGRNEAGQPWRTLAHTVVYRLGTGAGEGVNPPAPLNGASVRSLRIESTSGVDLATAQLKAQAEFEPIRLAFVASGAAPFELALGRAGAAPGAVAYSAVAAAIGTRMLKELPEATVGAARPADRAHPSLLESVWPSSPGKPTVLWTVLIAGVLILAAVAWSLLRQLKADAANPPKTTNN